MGEIPHMKNVLRKIKNRGITIKAIGIGMLFPFLFGCALIFYFNIRLQSKLLIVSEKNAIRVGNGNDMHRLLMAQRVCIILMVLLIGVVAVLLYTQVIRIIKQYAQCAARGELLDGKGILELRQLAEAYNDMCDKQCEKAGQLRKHIENDTLTKVVKQGAFEKIVGKILDGEEERGCLLLIDTDKLNEINDSYSHDMGDAVLKNIAATLERSFRSCDCIGRIGDDEFAVWLGELYRDSTEYIRKRIAAINDRLLHPEDGIPPVTLSVGVAFSCPGDNYKSLFKRAEKALYRVKTGGRCGCEVQDE